jgi:hypothetical protein
MKQTYVHWIYVDRNHPPKKKEHVLMIGISLWDRSIGFATGLNILLDENQVGLSWSIKGNWSNDERVVLKMDKRHTSCYFRSTEQRSPFSPLSCLFSYYFRSTKVGICRFQSLSEFHRLYIWSIRYVAVSNSSNNDRWYKHTLGSLQLEIRINHKISNIQDQFRRCSCLVFFNQYVLC